MNYEKITWQVGDTITAGKLNRIEQGIQDAADALDNTLQQSSLKTINSISIVGEGNIEINDTTLQEADFKTINGNSILGSGDIAIAGITETEKQEIEQMKTDLAQLSAEVENLKQNSGTGSAEVYKGEIEYN